jgi:foldase protein PrsA
VKKYSIDEASKSQGGLLPPSPRDSRRSVRHAIFQAPKSKIQGPVKTQFGWYVFRGGER